MFRSSSRDHFPSLFPDGVATSIATAEMWEGTLYPDEEVFIRNAVSKRRREFTAGRVCARRTLALLGVEDRPLPVGSDRLVVWPEGTVGSISHCDDLCAVAVARCGTVASLGLDVEPTTPLEAHLLAWICTPTEQERFKALQSPPGVSWPKLAFVAKESVYKCVFPVVRTFLEFHDVEIRPAADAGSFEATLRHPCTAKLGVGSLTGRFAVSGGHIFCGVTLPVAAR